MNEPSRPFGGRRIVTLGVLVVAATLVGCVILPPPSGEEPKSFYSIVDEQRSRETTRPPADLSELSTQERTIVQIYRRVGESVVNITTIALSPGWILGPIPQQGTGSGVVIEKDGSIVTNYHVIASADRIVVTFSDGRHYNADIVGVDPETDLALLRIDAPPDRLKPITFGTSSSLSVGQTVISVGNPFGLEGTLTTGVISGLRRPMRSSEGFILKELIQTDAAINPGNSGGPLLSSRGELIGINTMIISPTGASVGIGFAVPIDTVMRIVPELEEFGRVRRGWIDIVPVPLSPQLAYSIGAPLDWGIMISEVRSDSTAAAAGLQGGSWNNTVRLGGNRILLGGDVILTVDDHPVPTFADYIGALEDTKPGDVAELEVYRNGNVVSVAVELAPRSTRAP